MCENAAVAVQGAGFCFQRSVRDFTVQARIASISDCGPSMVTMRFRL